MCGLIGIRKVTKNRTTLISDAMEVLRRLEYRGYDSAGVMFIENNEINYLKKIGPVQGLYNEVSPYLESNSPVCLAHTRWATTGKVSEDNCHPHHSLGNLIHLVHNGIIENCEELRSKLKSEGYVFYGQTDSEVLANWLEYNLNGNTADAHSQFKIALSKVKGTYGLAIYFNGNLHGFHKGNPLVLGRSNDAYYLCSDLNALSGIATEGFALGEGSSVMINDDGIHIDNGSSNFSEISVTESYELDGYESFTEKEILSQYNTLQMTIAGRYSNGEIRISALDDNKEILKNTERVRIIAEGTSYHAGLVGKYLIEKYAGVRTQVELASEFNNSNPIVDPNELFIFISQSGETADVIQALREAKTKNCDCMGITNGVDSQLARMTDFGIYLRCGVEIGVASTKAFTSTILVLSMLACKMGRQRRFTAREAEHTINPVGIISKFELSEYHQMVSSLVLNYLDEINSFIFLGVGPYYPIAMESALKMNELSYIPCLSYASGALKHGPLSLVDSDKLFVILDTDPEYHAVNKICIDELHSRNARILVIKCSSDYNDYPDGVLSIDMDQGNRETYRLIDTAIVMQSLAYFMAKKLGRSIDKPRNLAKSVTVR